MPQLYLSAAASSSKRSARSGGEQYSKRVTLYGTVLRDEAAGLWRMWYMCRMGPPSTSPPHRIPELYCPRDDTKPPSFEGATEDAHGRAFVDNDRGDLTCCKAISICRACPLARQESITLADAESQDGLTWSKPDIGVVTYNGSPDNNIVWDLHGASVFPAPGGGFTAVGFCRRYRDVFLISSEDGKQWDDTQSLEPVAKRNNEGCFNVVWDEMTDQYRGFALSRGGPEEVKIRGSTVRKRTPTCLPSPCSSSLTRAPR